MPLPDWSRAHGAPLFAGVIRTHPGDFVVHEDLGVEFAGTGEHDFLHVEKIAANTEWLQRRLAEFAGVAAKDVGYSGLKDRHAVTRQWFSVPRWNAPDWDDLSIAGVEVLDVERHTRKLRRGTHKANRFRIVLRGDLPATETLQQRLELLQREGVPNYFGEQRFGRDGANVSLADQWSSGERLPRHRRSLAISSARSYLFNLMLDARVANESWNIMLAGDSANLDGTGSVFQVDAVDATIAARCRDMDIHPTAPLCGEGGAPERIPDGYENWLDALRKARVKASQRSLRLPLRAFDWLIEDGALTLRFRLGRGAFATAVLREIGVVCAAER